MFINVICFTAGIILLQWQRTLPNIYLFWLTPLLLFGFLRFHWFRMPGAIILGFLWAAFDAHLGLESSLSTDLYSQDISITGTVSSLPDQKDRYVSFEFTVDETNYRNISYPSPGIVRLNWYTNTQEIRGGDRWRLKVRLKPAHGFMNPAGFDYEGWLFHRGVRATGYVRDDSLNRLLGKETYRFGLQGLRQHIRSVIETQLQDGKATALLKALIIGDRSGLSASEWELFRLTGTNHLVAISGLHIGIVGGLAFYLVSACWRRIPSLALRVATPKAATVAAVAAGTGYAALAGFSIPTQRALIMLMVVAAGVILQSEFRSFRSLALALLIIIALDPAAVLSPGFWLSFTAVAVIFIGVSHRTGRPRILFSWFGIQWLIGLGLTPVLLIWQQQVPLIGPLANMLAIPLFSLLIIPLALAGTMLSMVWHQGGYVPMIAADWLLDIARTLLAQAAQSPLQFSAPPALPCYVWMVVAFGIFLLLLPRAIPGHIPGVLMLLPLIVHSPGSTPRSEVFRFALLDVGQGMAAVVQTQNRTLVYDAGPAYSQDFNAGSDILVPFLRKRGITRIDRLILSNGDSDHQGGLAGLIGKIPINEVLSGEPSRIVETTARTCTAGMEWSWDGVTFKILHPNPENNWRGNNASCVLLVANTSGRLLITGDIEAEVEKHLVECCRNELAANLVTMPHHGSASSSTGQIVQAVGPIFALASTGYLNRYAFPKTQVVSRWKTQGARVLDTALSGTIEFVFDPEFGIIGPDRYRYRASRYWTHLPEMNGGSH